ncbi:MAG: HAD-IA family hydrolase [Pseudomonadota bacterium]|nr:HAD-IA family hydrolase [Pseudomonadota bacterium]
MNAKPQAVLFDLDGTLLDTAPQFVQCLHQLLEEQPGVHPATDAAVRACVSEGAAALIKLTYGAGAEVERPDLLQRLLALYAADPISRTHPFPGTAQLLEWLDGSGTLWGIVTNKPRRFTEPLLAGVAGRLRSTPAVVVCGDDLRESKPHPQPLLHALHQIAIEPQAAVYVGDHRRDVEAGRAAKLYTVAAAYGYIGFDEEVASWAADLTIDSLDQLHVWLAGREETAHV